MNGIKLNKETLERIACAMWESGGEPINWDDLEEQDEPLKKELRRMAKVGIEKYLALCEA